MKQELWKAVKLHILQRVRGEPYKDSGTSHFCTVFRDLSPSNSE